MINKLLFGLSKIYNSSLIDLSETLALVKGRPASIWRCLHGSTLAFACSCSFWRWRLQSVSIEHLRSRGLILCGDLPNKIISHGGWLCRSHQISLLWSQVLWLRGVEPSRWIKCYLVIEINWKSCIWICCTAFFVSGVGYWLFSFHSSETIRLLISSDFSRRRQFFIWWLPHVSIRSFRWDHRFNSLRHYILSFSSIKRLIIHPCLVNAKLLGRINWQSLHSLLHGLQIIVIRLRSLIWSFLLNLSSR